MEYAEAVRKLGAKVAVGSSLTSKQWADVPLALKDRAFFSSTLAQAQVAAGLQQRVLGVGTKAEFVAKARPWMLQNGFLRPQNQEDLKALAGTRRLELIFEQNTQAARGYGWWKQGQQADVLDAFPAQEFLRIEARKVPRQSWRARWTAAGGQLWGGRMVALKSDQVWTRLSRFGTPWPPYDFGSGMGVEDVSREEAEALGLLQPGAPVQGDERAFNDKLQASVESIDREMQDGLDLAFGDQVTIKDGKAAWTATEPYTDWKAQGLLSAKAWTISEPIPPRMDPAQAREAMQEGVVVPTPRGDYVHFNQKTLKHWSGYHDEAERPAHLPAAIRTVEAPVEVWIQSTQTVYIAAYTRPQNGYRGVVVFVDRDGNAITYFVKHLSELDKARKGVRRSSL